MNLYLDASALVKRYVAEPGSDVVRSAMDDATGWFVCRTGYVEVIRAVELAGGKRAGARAREEWSAIGIIEVDQTLVEEAAALAVRHRLRSLDALHLAAARVLPANDLLLATWDRRLRAAAVQLRIAVLPDDLG